MLKEEEINMLWVGRSLSPLEFLSIKSYIENDHPVLLWTYDKYIKNVPDGTTLMDANEIVPEDRLFANKAGTHAGGTFAGFSDWFRYELLLHRGGWWSDSDMIALKPFRFPHDVVIPSGTGAKPGKLATAEAAECCVLRFPVDHDMMREMAEYCRAINIQEAVSKDYISVGPGLVKKFVEKYSLSNRVTGRNVFWPVSWRHVSFFVAGPLERHTYNMKRRIRGGERINWISRETIGVHLCQGCWKNAKIDLWAAHHPNSFYEQMKRRYLK